MTARFGHPRLLHPLPIVTQAALALFLLLGTSLLHAADAVTIYAPLVYTYPLDVVPDYGTVVMQTGWESRLAAFNPTDSETSIEVLAAYGPAGPIDKGGAPNNVTHLAPFGGAQVQWALSIIPRFGVAFLELRTPPEVLINGDLLLVRRYFGCESVIGDASVPQGQVALPVFRELFPAGSTAIAGSVELGRLTKSQLCATYAREYRRRVNVTLFNAGDTEATFRISEFALRATPTPLYETTMRVGAKRVFQINGIPVPTEDSAEIAASISGDGIWFKVTADQPFLYYVSTVFDDPDPGAAPFQVYKPTLLSAPAQ